VFKRIILSAAIASILSFIPTVRADPVEEVFAGGPTPTKEWSLKDLNADLPSDWTGYNFLVLEFRASSPQRFDLLIRTSDKTISKRIHPFQNTLVRAAIPLKYFSDAPTGGNDLASLVNHAGLSYFINIENGGYGPLNNVQAIGVDMHDPLGSPKLEIESVSLAKDSPGDAVLDPKVIVDEFGQWIPADWPGKAKSLDDLKAAWNEIRRIRGYVRQRDGVLSCRADRRQMVVHRPRWTLFLVQRRQRHRHLRRHANRRARNHFFDDSPFWRTRERSKFRRRFWRRGDGILFHAEYSAPISRK
jgi:hypothetical protein